MDITDEQTKAGIFCDNFDDIDDNND